jgi:hypothetical protein
MRHETQLDTALAVERCPQDASTAASKRYSIQYLLLDTLHAASHTSTHAIDAQLNMIFQSDNT